MKSVVCNKSIHISHNSLHNSGCDPIDTMLLESGFIEDVVFISISQEKNSPFSACVGVSGVETVLVSTLILQGAEEQSRT